MQLFAILVSRDGRSWLLQNVYAGTAIFHDLEKCRSHIEAIRCPGTEFKVIRLNAEVIE